MTLRDLVFMALACGLAGAVPASTLPEAVTAENDSLVAALIAAGADLEAGDPGHDGATALMLAAERNDEALARRLLAAGADPDTRDRNGDTALNWAAYYGHTETARVLLEAGADPAIAGHGNALQIALRRGWEDLVQVLSLALDQRTPPGGRDTRVMLAVLRNDADAVEDAIAAGGSPDAHDDIGRPVLHVAARLGHAPATWALLAAGATVDAVDLNGFTALMVAAREAHADLTDELLAAGASISHTADAWGNGLQPLHLAAIGGDTSIVRSFAEAGADLDARDVDGVVPMLWALAEGNTDCVVALIDLGADPTIASKDGDSVAEIARRYGMQTVLDAMTAAGH